jgi:hypothetical protein
LQSWSRERQKFANQPARTAQVFGTFLIALPLQEAVRHDAPDFGDDVVLLQMVHKSGNSR